MPSRFEKYRLKDGLTKLGEAFFNPVFQDIDLRISGLEGLRISWEEAVRAVSAYGLVRINEVVGPALIEATEKADEIEVKRLAAIDALAELESAIASFEAATSADLNAWKATELAAIQAWKDGITPSLPALNARLDAIEGIPAFSVVTYANRASLRLGAPTADQKAVVEGLGLFVFYVGSAEPDDDESCFATGNGRWLLEAPSWDLVDAWRLPDTDYGEEVLFGLRDRWPGRVLFGVAPCAITSVASVQRASFTGVVGGAAVGDMVVATPPDALDAGKIAHFALVTAPNTVTVYINNPSAVLATLTPGTWSLAVFKTT